MRIERRQPETGIVTWPSSSESQRKARRPEKNISSHLERDSKIMSKRPPDSVGCEIKRPRVVVVGPYQVGKSTVVTCLLRRRISPSGLGMSTTHACWRFVDGPPVFATLILDGGTRQKMSIDRLLTVSPTADCVEIVVPQQSSILTALELVDTPGGLASGEVGRVDERRASQALSRSDFAILVVPNRQLSQPLIEYLAERLSGLPFAVLMNCIEGSLVPNSESNRRTAATIQAQLAMRKMHPIRIPKSGVVCAINAAWDRVAGILRYSGSEREQLNNVNEGMDARLIEGVDAYFRLRKQDRPNPAILAEMGAMDPLREFLQGTGSHLGNLQDIVTLRRRYEDWMGPMRVAAQTVFNLGGGGV